MSPSAPDDVPAITRFYRRHWFGGTFLIILGVWLVTMAFYVAGADGITFPTGQVQDATIDFSREYDHEVRDLGHGRGLELREANHGYPISGTVITLGDGLPGFCLICGQKKSREGLTGVDYRDGDWLYRKPRIQKVDPKLPQRTKDHLLTIAFNTRTGERVMVTENDSAEQQATVLLHHDLNLASAEPLSSASLADLPEVSMQREGCVIVNAAFIAAMLLWLVVGGLALLIVKGVRRARPA